MLPDPPPRACSPHSSQPHHICLTLQPLPISRRTTSASVKARSNQAREAVRRECLSARGSCARPGLAEGQHQEELLWNCQSEPRVIKVPEHSSLPPLRWIHCPAIGAAEEAPPTARLRRGGQKGAGVGGRGWEGWGLGVGGGGASGGCATGRGQTCSADSCWPCGTCNFS